MVTDENGIWAGMTAWWLEAVNGHTTTASRRHAVPDVGAHVDLEIAFGRECLTADCATERFVARVRSHMYLQRAGARERFLTHLAHVTQVRQSTGR